MYRLHSEWPDSESELSQALETEAFKPCSAFTEESYGFEPPVEAEDKSLARRLAGADLMQLRLQSKILPTAAVNEALVERVAEFSSRMLRDPSRKEKRDLKESVYGELLPQALLKSERIRGFYLPQEEVLAVCTSSEKTADMFIESLRDALGSLLVTPFACRKPGKQLLGSVFMGKSGSAFKIGAECRMKDPGDEKASVTWSEVNLEDASVRKHVADGFYVDKLGLIFGEVAALTLDEELIFRKFKVEGGDGAYDELPEEDPLARHDAEFVLESGIIGRVVAALKNELGGFEER